MIGERKNPDLGDVQHDDRENRVQHHPSVRLVAAWEHAIEPGQPFVMNGRARRHREDSKKDNGYVYPPVVVWQGFGYGLRLIPFLNK